MVRAYLAVQNAIADYVRAPGASHQLQDEPERPADDSHPVVDPRGGIRCTDGRRALEQFPWGAQNWVVRAPDFRSELLAAVDRGDGPAVVTLLRDQSLAEDALQLIGDGLLVALTQNTKGATRPADACRAALRERGWDGDDELADQLDALLGTGTIPLLRPMPVDLEELAGVLEGDPTFGGGRLDLLTGQVWPQAAIDYARETGEEDEEETDDPARWLWVHCEGSSAGYHDMVDFVGTVDDPGRADRLGIAIEGRGAFRRFKDVLARWPGELDRWYSYADDRQRGRARAWLAEAGYRPTRTGHGPPGE